MNLKILNYNVTNINKIYIYYLHYIQTKHIKDFSTKTKKTKSRKYGILLKIRIIDLKIIKENLNAN